MFDFFIHRLAKKAFLLALLCGIVIAILQILESSNQIIGHKAHYFFNDSPYTLWISIDPFHASSMIFYILIPLIASIPAGMMIKDDLASGFFQQLQVRKNIDQILGGYFTASFVTGFLVILISLIVNYAIFFMLMPNVKPDDLLNSNLGIYSRDTLFINVYFEHPFLHGFMFTLFASVWGGIFASFTTACSIWIKVRFVPLFAGFALQVVLTMLNIAGTPLFNNSINISPADFTRETTGMVDQNTAVLTTFAMLLVIILIVWIGRQKKIVW
jgi:hypothetical protein